VACPVQGGISLSLLLAALAYRARGFIVVPIAAGLKKPTIDDWPNEPPQTEARVQALFKGHRGGIGIVCGAAAGLVAVDVDVKPGKVGEASLIAWEDVHGPLPQTLTHATPSGGGHLFFRLPEGCEPIGGWKCMGKDIDVQCQGQQVVAPPTEGYRVWVNAPIAECPPALLTALRNKPAGEIQPHADDLVPGELFDHRVAWYTRWLTTEAPICVEGKGGDTTLFEVVQQGAWDCLLPTATVLELVREHYDPRCQPPWGGALTERVRHKSFQAKTVSTRPRSPPPTPEEAEILLGSRIESLRAVAVKTPPRDRWDPIPSDEWIIEPPEPEFLIDKLIIKGSVSMLYAEPGGIKSFTTLDWARSIAQGLPWLDYACPTTGPVLWVDFEDAITEFRRRLWLLNKGRCQGIHYLYDPGELNGPKGPNIEHWRKLAGLIDRLGIVAVFFDTMGSSQGGVDENDTKASQGVKTSKILTEEGCSVIWTHHANRQGNVRGTSAFKADVDHMLKLEAVDGGDAGTSDNPIHRATITWEKSGYKKPAPMRLLLDNAGLRTFELEEIPSATPQQEDPNALDNRILVLLATGPQGVNRLARELKVRKGAVTRSLDLLAEEGKIVKVIHGWGLAK
jgi:hypothetical protein